MIDLISGRSHFTVRNMYESFLDKQYLNAVTYIGQPESSKLSALRRGKMSGKPSLLRNHGTISRIVVLCMATVKQLLTLSNACHETNTYDRLSLGGHV